MSKSPSEMKIVVCGLARDCRKNLRRNWLSLEPLMARYGSVDWVIVENDSVDGTREWLAEKAARNSRIHVIGEPIGEKSMPDQATAGTVRPWFSRARIGKMTFFRNQYLEFIGTRFGFDNVDAVLVLDFDVHRLPVSRIGWWLDHFEPDTAVSALGVYWRSFTRKGFYDAYAHLALDESLPKSEKTVLDGRRDLYLKYRNERRPVPVLSNFNGCAIYPGHLLEGAAYRLLPNADPHVEYLCEHISLHRALHEKGGRLLLDPALKVVYAPAHEDWKRHLGNLLKGRR
ncbi:MAG: hypothetical protein QM627_04145 [Luteolibacter sp.]